MIALHIPLNEATRGRWRDILVPLGLPANMLNGRHGPCPICREGRDRFRFDDKEGRGTFICTVCGAGDGFEFVKKKHGVDFKGAAALIEPLIGAAAAQAVRAGPSEADLQRWRNDTWRGAQAVQTDDPVGLYLKARGGLDRFSSCLRFHPALEHRDGDGNRSRHPAMLALVLGPDGKPANIHRTYLTADGRKASVAPVRRMGPGQLPIGAAIRLSAPAELMGIAEGVETALAAAALGNLPVWAALSDQNLARWTPPAGTQRVIVFGDCDAGYAGQAAAYALAKSISGRRLAEVEVRIPDQIGMDWNDVLLAKAKVRELA